MEGTAAATTKQGVIRVTVRLAGLQALWFSPSGLRLSEQRGPQEWSSGRVMIRFYDFEPEGLGVVMKDSMGCGFRVEGFRVLGGFVWQRVSIFPHGSVFWAFQVSQERHVRTVPRHCLGLWV